jgi:ferredoxin
MRVEVDLSVCIASGQCARRAPSVFDQNEEDGVVVLRQAVPPKDAREAVLQAAADCPSGAITVKTDE